MSLRSQVLALLLFLAAVGVGLPGGSLIWWLRADLNAETETTNEALTRALVAKGTAVALNAAVASEAAIEVMDFLFLTEVINSITSTDPEVPYGFIMNKNGRVAVHSDPTKAGKSIESETAKEALAKGKAVSRPVEINGQPGLEVAVPISVAGFPWGTLHLGLSQKGLGEAIAAAQGATHASIRQGARAVGLAALLVLLVVLVVGLLIARGIMKPLTSLLEGMAKIQAGARDHVVPLSGSREFVVLGAAVNELSLEIRGRDEKVQGNIAKLDAALKELRATTLQREQFLANVSHELRTPLNAILAAPQRLAEDFQERPVLRCMKCDSFYEPEAGEQGGGQPCPECGKTLAAEVRLLFAGDVAEHAHFIERINTSTATMRTIVQSLVDLSSLGAAAGVPKRQLLDIRGVIDLVKAPILELARAAEVDARFPSFTAPVMLNVDGTMLTQILLNLLGNAVKFTPKGGVVRLEVEPAAVDGGHFVEFRVADSGIGLEKKELENVFKEFYQVDGGHTRSKGGTGLGLTIARRIVELHGGRIFADSPGLNKGTTFFFRLPAEPTAAATGGR